ncbi:MAG: nicotinate-nucleotide adenylyltransferase, partial [Candidatus Omnitrophota bacterium]
AGQRPGAGLRIGIFGGSFNPVHRGHLKLAREAASELGLQKVFFVPSGRTPLKKDETLLPAALRVKLLKKAVGDDPAFRVSLCEIKRKGASYTVDTLKFFKKKFGKSATLYFLSGADTLKNLSRWRSPSEVLRLCRFVAFSRPGVHPRRVPKEVLFVPFDALPVSSSDIRKRLRQGKPVGRLVPPGTEKSLKAYFKERSF